MSLRCLSHALPVVVCVPSTWDVRAYVIGGQGSLRPNAVRDVTFIVPQGQTWALVGANGAGKSTLLSLATRLREVDDGAVRVLGAFVSLVVPEWCTIEWRQRVDLELLSALYIMSLGGLVVVVGLACP